MIDPAPTTSPSPFCGSGEGGEVSGSAFVELDEADEPVIELSFRLGDDAVLKARQVQENAERTPHSRG